MQHPGCPESTGDIRPIVRFEPPARRGEGLAEELRELPRPAPPRLARQKLGCRPAPQLTAEKGKEQRRVLLDAADIGEMLGAVARAKPVEGRAIVGALHADDGRAPIRPDHARRMIAVAEFETMLAEIGAKRRVARRGDEQDEGRRHHIMDETRRRDLLAADTAAYAIIALEHQHTLAVLAEHCGGDKGIDAAAN